MATSASPDFIPVGSVFAYAGLDVPNGYLLCDGSIISKELYWELFRAIGYIFTAMTGGDNFQVPDLVETFVSGTDLVTGVTDPTTNPTITANFTLTASNIPSFNCDNGVTGTFSITNNGAQMTTKSSSTGFNATADNEAFFKESSTTKDNVIVTGSAWTPTYTGTNTENSTPLTLTDVGAVSFEMTYIIKAWSDINVPPKPKPQNVNLTFLPPSTAINPLADNPNYSGFF
jgi:microcystin-dependent protein